MIRAPTTSPQAFISAVIKPLFCQKERKRTNLWTSSLTDFSLLLHLLSFLFPSLPMASSSSVPPVGSAPPLTTGERSETLAAGSTAPAEAVVDALVALPSFSSEAVFVVPPSFFDEANDPREGFVFPLVDPWYEISPLFPCKSFDFFSSPEDWDWTVTGPKVVVDRAWVPCLDEIFDLLIQKGDIRPIPINFEFPCVVSKDWSC